MDLRHFYSKVRELEAQIEDEFTVIVSHETGDGGKEGMLTEVKARLAATMVVGGLARLATEAEKEAFFAAQAEAKYVVDQMAAAAKVQFTVLSTADLERFKGGTKSRKAE